MVGEEKGLSSWAIIHEGYLAAKQYSREGRSGEALVRKPQGHMRL